MLMNCEDRTASIQNSQPFWLISPDGDRELVLCLRTDTCPEGYTFEEIDYWQDEYPEYPVCDWQYEVAEGNTRLGYWEWCLGREAMDSSDSEESEDE
jgi:hypothetical protein